MDYIVQNPEAVLNMNASQLAKASYTSASTIIRLCQKVFLGGSKVMQTLRPFMPLSMQ